MRISALPGLLLLVFSVAGCVSAYDKESWIGQTEDNLVAEWGPPEEVIRNEVGGKTLVYVRTDPHSSRGGSDVYRYGSGTRDADVPGEPKKWQRRYLFRVNEEGIVYDSSVQKTEVISPE